MVGHLGSALPPGVLQGEDPEGLAHALKAALEEFSSETMHEQITTTAPLASGNDGNSRACQRASMRPGSGIAAFILLRKAFSAIALSLTTSRTIRMRRMARP